jgi:hypothetical protein
MTANRSAEEEEAYPHWLLCAEAEALRLRRKQLSPVAQPPAEAPAVGLALSGGGIRSATFSLGLVQVLARRGILPKVDYLSTVSGGGYIGAFLGALHARGGSDEVVRQTLTKFPESRELHWLRSNGRFLAPNGAAASWLAGAVLLRNWVSLMVVLAPVALLVFFVGVLARISLSELAPALGALLPVNAWPPVVGGVELSPLLVAPLLCALYWLMPCGIAYWMVNAGHRTSRGPFASSMAVVLTICVPSVLAWKYRGAGWYPYAVLAIAGTTALAFFSASLLRWRLQADSHAEARFDPFGPDHDNVARNKLSEWLKGALMGVCATLLITLVDTVGFAAFEALSHESELSVALQKLMALASGVAGVVLATHRILAQLGPKNQREGTRVPVQLLTATAAIAILLLGATVVSASTYFMTVSHPRASLAPSPESAALGVVISFTVMALLGRFVPFVNQSSLGPIYKARLTRAYVGASNPNRGEGSTFKGKESPTEPIPGDELEWEKYKPHERGGPLHLINVTVNETVDPRVQLHQPDRKGMNMAVGPMGISLGVRHHASWTGNAAPPEWPRFRVFPTGKELLGAERLPLGHWVAISGAAVATGLGQLSRWGTSLLCGVFNMRLGYWWYSNVSPHKRRHQAKAISLTGPLMTVFGYLFPVYRFLIAEFLGRFPGTAIDSWYLTDGGHLENTGCYELIRRRVPFIICADNGADLTAECSDLANLVRLARVDFGAEVEFLDATQLAHVLDPALAEYFGSLQALSPDPSRRKAYAGLARVRYPEGKTSWLVVIKPTLLGTEPVDVSAYRLENPSFPQQSTGDQSFDDAQWEAYRKLGECIGSRLFDTPLTESESKWRPEWLDQRALELLERECAQPVSGVARTNTAAGVPVSFTST